MNTGYRFMNDLIEEISSGRSISMDEKEQLTAEIKKRITKYIKSNGVFVMFNCYQKEVTYNDRNKRSNSQGL